jgi:hypothetical protein
MKASANRSKHGQPRHDQKHALQADAVGPDAPELPRHPFRILVSPFINFDPETRDTDVLICNSKSLGALIVQEDRHVRRWEDGQYNMNHMSIEETYGFGILNEGQAIAVAKHVKIRPNEFTCRHAASSTCRRRTTPAPDQGNPSFLSLCHHPHPLPLYPPKSNSTPFLACLFHCSAPWLKPAQTAFPRPCYPQPSHGAEMTLPNLQKVRESEYDPARKCGDLGKALFSSNKPFPVPGPTCHTLGKLLLPLAHGSST